MKLSVVASNYNLFERREIFVLMYGLYIFGSWSLFYTQLHMCHTDFRCIIIRIKTRDGELHHNISTRDYPPIWCVDMDLIHRSGKKESFFFVDIQNCVNFTICSFCHWCTNFWLKQSISMQLTNVLKEHIRGKAIKIVIILGLIMSLLAYEEQIFDESEIWNCWIVFFSVNTDGIIPVLKVSWMNPFRSGCSIFTKFYVNYRFILSLQCNSAMLVFFST